MNIDRNEFLQQSLPGLYANDPVTQSDVYQQLFHELKHHAWTWIKDQHLGEDAANKGLDAFLRKCANSPLTDESYPLAYLYECVTKVVQKMWVRRFQYPCTLKIKAHTVFRGGTTTRVWISDSSRAFPRFRTLWTN